MTILFLENDLFFSRIVERIFRAKGLHMFHTQKAQEALIWMREKEPDAILLEVCGTSTNGFSFMKDIQKFAFSKEVPVMVWTHLAGREDVDRCFELGASEFFLKQQHRPEDVASHLLRRRKEV